MFHMGRGFSTCSSCQSQTPGTTDSGQDDRGIHDELSDEAGTHAQATAAFAQYIALDWPDIAYAVKTALQSMTKPDKLMLLRVVRVGMYLRQHPRLVWCFGQHFALVMQTFTARKTRMRSTTGTAMVFGHFPPEVVTDTVAKGPLDKGFYALTKVAPHAKQLAGIMSVLVLQVRWSAAMPRQASGLQVVRVVASHVTSRQSGSVSRTSSQRIVSWCARCRRR